MNKKITTSIKEQGQDFASKLYGSPITQPFY